MEQTSMDEIREMIQGASFTHIEVSAVNESDGDIQVTRDKSEISFYSTYLHDGFASWIGDHATAEEAMAYAQEIAQKFNLQIINNIE